MKKAILIIFAVLILYAGIQFSSFGIMKTTGDPLALDKPAVTEEPPQEAVVEVEAEAGTTVPAEETDTAEAVPEPEATPEPLPTPKPDLPPLPDIDINSFEFLLANSYNSIGMEYAPPYANFEGQGIDARIQEQANAFVTAAREACTNAWVSTAFRNSEFLNSWYLSYYNNVYNGDPIETANHFLAQGID